MVKKYWLDPLDSVQLLAAVLCELASPGTRTAVEGGSSLLELAKLPGASIGPLPFSVNVCGHGSTMVVLPLNSQRDARSLIQRLTKGGNVSPEVGAVQVERNGSVEFLAADSFHRECVSVGPGLPDSFWESLVHQGAIRGFYSPQEAAERFGLTRRDS